MICVSTSSSAAEEPGLYCAHLVIRLNKVEGPNKRMEPFGCASDVVGKTSAEFAHNLDSVGLCQPADWSQGAQPATEAFQKRWTY